MAKELCLAEAMLRYPDRADFFGKCAVAYLEYNKEEFDAEISLAELDMCDLGLCYTTLDDWEVVDMRTTIDCLGRTYRIELNGFCMEEIEYETDEEFLNICLSYYSGSGYCGLSWDALYGEGMNCLGKYYDVYAQQYLDAESYAKLKEYMED